MNAPATKLNLGKLSAVAQIVVAKPDGDLLLSLIDVERQVRRDPGDLSELVASIKAIGVQQPIIVLAKDDGRYRLVAGERRFRASLLAGLTRIPVVIRRGLTDVQIRQIQITENNDREGLSSYDEAMGVAEDVEKYGHQQTMVIWNRSDAWVSKRAAVPKYADPVREVLETGLCGDLEVLHSLNQLYDINVDEYNGLVERLRSGVTVSRDDARNKVASVRQWTKQNEQARQVRNVAHPPADESDADGGAGDDPADDDGAPPAVVAGKGAGKQAGVKKAAKKSKAGKKGKAGKADASGQDCLPGLVLTDEQRAAADRESAQQALDALRAELMEWGDVLRPHFATLQTHMATLGYDLPQGEWVLWTGFLDTVLPMLASLGKDRAGGYLKRLQSELKASDPLTLWRELHPVGSTEDNGSGESANREAIVPMPEGWRF